MKKLVIALFVCAFAGTCNTAKDQAVIDDSTGLMWQKGKSVRVNWHEATNYCKGLTVGGHNKWRLPTLREMTDAIPFLEKSVNLADGMIYWTSTIYSGSSDRAMIYQIGSNLSIDYPQKNPLDVLCVRDSK